MDRVSGGSRRRPDRLWSDRAETALTGNVGQYLQGAWTGDAYTISNAGSTDDQLLEEVLAVVEPQRIEQIWRHKDEGLEIESARVRLDWGLGFSVGVDRYTIELLARVDGRRRLRDLFAEIGRDSQLGEEVVARAGLPAVRRLLELGFLARA